MLFPSTTTYGKIILILRYLQNFNFNFVFLFKISKFNLIGNRITMIKLMLFFLVNNVYFATSKECEKKIKKIKAQFRMKITVTDIGKDFF